MKGINIFIVLLILVFLISINNVSCESGNGTLTGYVSDEKSHNEFFGIDNLWNGDYRVKINLDLSGIPDTFKIQNVQAQNISTWGGTASNVGDPFNIYYSADGTTKTELVGYGVVYVHKKAFVSGNLFDVDLTFYIDDITIDKTGSQWYIFDGGWTVFNSYYNGLYYEMSSTKYNNFYNNLNCVVVPTGDLGNIYNLISPKNDQTVTYEYKYKGSFRNDYTYDVTSTSFDIDIQRQGFSETYDFKSSKIKVVDYTDDSTYYQSGYSTSNTSHFLNVDNYSYYLVRNIDEYEHLIFTFDLPVGDSEGTIELNQTSYTDPELIQIDVELTTYDFTDNSYYIITEVREDVGSFDNVAGVYNGTTKISTASESRTLDIDTWLYDLPLWVRVKLMEYEKTTGEYTTIYTTSMVRYNPSIPDGIKFGGTVIDADTNQIISGALVSVDGVTTASDTTNTFGEFLIYLYPGIYTVTASKTGYQTHTSEDLLMEFDNTWAQIYLTPIGYGNGTLYGNVNDANTGYAIQDVHVIITNTTDSISAYTSSGGYYEATGLAQSSTYTIQAVKSGYYTYNGSVTTETSGASHKSFNMVPETATPTPTATVLPTTTYPGGEGHEWTNDEIVTMLRVLVPGFFLLMLVFLLMAVMLGIGGNNGNNGQGRSGLSEIWRR